MKVRVNRFAGGQKRDRKEGREVKDKFIKGFGLSNTQGELPSREWEDRAITGL